MHAIIQAGGKQYRVEEGRSLKVDRLPGEEGETVELNDVLLLANGGDVSVGSPGIEGARVLATVEEQGRDKKIIVFKYKAKVRTRKKTGHRQGFTKLSVVEILAPGQEPKAVEKPKRARKAAGPDVPEAQPITEEPVAQASEAVAEEKPKRRVLRRSKTDEPKAAKEADSEKPKRPRRKKAEDKE